MTREDRAIDMRNRALELIKARGAPAGEHVPQYTNIGITIHHSFIADTQRLYVATKAGRVLIVEWESNGKFRVLSYIPGLWETQLRHLTQRATR